MAFEDLRDRVREQLTTLSARVQESPAWNELMERYLDLNPTAQRAALAGVGALAALILFLLPYAFFSASQDNMTAFEEKKQMMRELFRVSRAANVLPPAPPPMTSDDLRGAVQGVLGSERPPLLPEQTLSIIDFDNSKAQGSALPKGLTQKGVMVNLSRLNVDQIARISGRLQTLRPTAKITGLKVQATSQDPHYFDVTFRVVAFSLPQSAPPPARPGGKPSPSKP